MERKEPLAICGTYEDFIHKVVTKMTMDIDNAMTEFIVKTISNQPNVINIKVNADLICKAIQAYQNPTGQVLELKARINELELELAELRRAAHD